MVYRSKQRIHNQGISNGWDKMFKVFSDLGNADQDDHEILPDTNQNG